MATSDKSFNGELLESIFKTSKRQFRSMFAKSSATTATVHVVRIPVRDIFSMTAPGSLTCMKPACNRTLIYVPLSRHWKARFSATAICLPV